MDLLTLDAIENLKVGAVTSADITAGEDLTKGDSVSLYPDGKVYKSNILEEQQSIVPSTTFYDGGHDNYANSATVKLIGTDTIVNVYKDSSNQLVCVVGSIDQTTGRVTWGTEVVSSIVATEFLCHHYQTDTDKVIVALRDGTTTSSLVCIDISGTPVFGAELTLHTQAGSTDGFWTAVSENTTNGSLLACTVVNSTTTANDYIYGWCVSVNTGTNALTIEDGPVTIAQNTYNVAAKDFKINNFRTYGNQPEDFLDWRGWVHYSATSDRFVVFYREDETSGNLRVAKTRVVEMSATTITVHSEQEHDSGNTAGAYPEWGDGFYYDSAIDKYFVMLKGGNYGSNDNEFHLRNVRFNGGLTGVTLVTHATDFGSSDLAMLIYKDKQNTDEYAALVFSTSESRTLFRWDNTGNTFEAVDNSSSVSGAIDWYDFFDFGAGEQLLVARYVTSFIPGFGDVGELNAARLASVYWNTTVANNAESGLNFSTVEPIEGSTKEMKVHLGNNLYFETDTSNYRIVMATAGQWRRIKTLGIVTADVSAASTAKVELLPKKSGVEFEITGQNFQPGFAYYLRRDGVLSTKPEVWGGQNLYTNNYLGYAISSTKLIKNDERYALS